MIKFFSKDKKSEKYQELSLPIEKFFDGQNFGKNKIYVDDFKYYIFILYNYLFEKKIIKHIFKRF